MPGGIYLKFEVDGQSLKRLNGALKALAADDAPFLKAAMEDIGRRLVSEARGLAVCDALIAKFAVNVTLGGANPAPSSTVVKCLFERQSGLIDIEFGDVRFLGYEITLLVEEQATVSAVTGGS